MAGLEGFLVRRIVASALSNTFGYALGSAIAPTLAPLVQDLENTTWAAHPVAPLDADVAAEAELLGWYGDGDGQTEATLTGFDSTRFGVLKNLAGNAPPLETLLSLRRRDAITEPELELGIRQLGYLPEWRERVKAMSHVLPSVTDMVRFAVREAYNPAQVAALTLDAELPPAFVDDAANVGLTEARARLFWRAHWELPSAEQMAAMLFRGELEPEAFSGGLKALDYAPTWRPKLEAILRPIPPLSDMIRFAVREVYSPSQVADLGLDEDFPAVFAEQASLHGMSPDYAQQYWRAHWRLPSALQGYRMLWRGLISPAELDALLKALDYPPKWRAHLAAISHIVPGRIDLKRMLKYDIKTPAEVEAGYRRIGYGAEDARDMRIIAEHELAAGGPSNSHVQRARTTLFGRVHTEFVGRQLTPDEARAGLAAAGVPAGQIPTVLELWQTEAELVRTELTQAQIVKAWKKGLYEEAEALAELVERGLTERDAKIRLDSG